MIEIVDLGLSFLQMFLGKFKSQLPAEIVASVQAAVDALAAHKDDLITKQNLENQRG